ncbi:uncharacterized protein EI90DRAFT_3288547 [Cantharellus anzutake]|uniref:uncharacterized protein n=1 Tax=Cantharellus anzutake TaxID=1750568 RepID=UPI001908FB81|nr:uncharacterized protein EI90DRAFT_3288547 [Cantharellus anzutake]KAF8333452.1 hypothetical protein EI90DRAFT_3288547 [Cantharellus anzutake]
MSTFTAPDTKLKELRPDGLSYVSADQQRRDCKVTAWMLSKIPHSLNLTNCTGLCPNPAKETSETFIHNTTAACYKPTAMEFSPFSMRDSGLPEQKLKEPRPDGLDYVLEDRKAAHTEDSRAAGGSLTLSGPNSAGIVEHAGTAKGMATAQDLPCMNHEPVAAESSPVIAQNSETGCAAVKPESTEAAMIARIAPKSFTGLDICFLRSPLSKLKSYARQKTANALVGAMGIIYADPESLAATAMTVVFPTNVLIVDLPSRNQSQRLIIKLFLAAPVPVCCIGHAPSSRSQGKSLLR